MISKAFASDRIIGRDSQLIEKELSPKTITEMLMVVKQIKTSCVDADGNPIFSCQWNGKYIDAPSISKQKRLCPKREEVEKAIKDAQDHQTQLLFAVLSGSGLRISEALAIHFQGSEQQTSWTAESSAVMVRSTIFRGKELLGHTKSDAGTRQVDLYPSLNEAITEFVAKNNRKAGDLLFQSDGKPFQSRSALNQLRKLGYGFHGFRRFRISRLENGGVPRRLTQLWAGHGAKDLTDVYVSAEEAEFRKGWAKQIGLGFSLEKVGLPAPKPLITKTLSPPKPTKPDPRRASMVVKKTLVRRKKRSLKALIRQDKKDRSAAAPYQASDADLPAEILTPAPISEADIELARAELESLR